MLVAFVPPVVVVVVVVVNRTLTGSYDRFRMALIRPKIPSTKRLYLLIRMSGTAGSDTVGLPDDGAAVVSMAPANL